MLFGLLQKEYQLYDWGEPEEIPGCGCSSQEIEHQSAWVRKWCTCLLFEELEICLRKYSIYDCLLVFATCEWNNLQLFSYVSCVVGCPYEGHVEPRIVADVSNKSHYNHWLTTWPLHQVLYWQLRPFAISREEELCFSSCIMCIDDAPKVASLIWPLPPPNNESNGRLEK